METTENYVYKKEVDWSLLTEGLTLPIENQVVFGRNMGKFLSRGETREIKLFFEGKTYKAQIRNVKFNEAKYSRKDVLQIRYPKDGEFANILKAYFAKSFQFIVEKRAIRDPKDRKMIRLPEEYKEYLAIYTTEDEDTYLLEAIVADDIFALKAIMNGQQERVIEATFNYDIIDDNANLYDTQRIVKIRKLNKKIGDNLKLLYNYRCQICGKSIGDQYEARVAEAHHIDYFVKSLNNDANNQIILCPNHHSIIHYVNPVFDRKQLIYLYPNGVVQRVILNQHL